VSALLPFALAFLLVAVIGSSVRARMLGSLLRDLARPTHEVRGALSALDLGLSLVDRSPLSGLELAARSDGLRLQLARAREALAEIDAVRCGENASQGFATSPRRARHGHDGGLVDLTSLVRERSRAWSQLAPGYGAALRLAWSTGPAWVRADRRHLSKALDNLIANALEHGGGRVLVEGERNGSRVRIAISDGGTGLAVAPGSIEEAPPSSSRGHGLAIARDAIQQLGGTLSSTLRLGRAGVLIELPLEPSVGQSSNGAVSRQHRAPASTRAA
jgi:signal transduction histidine kinase